MVSDWPKFEEKYNFAAEETEIEHIKEAVRAIRNARANMNVPPSRKAKVFVASADAALRDIFGRGEKYIMALASSAEVVVQADKSGIEDNAVSIVVPGAEIYMPLADLVDFEKEKARLAKEIEKLEKEVGRVTAKLGNPGFVDKAPAKVIEEEREKEKKYKEMLAVVTEQLRAIGGN